MRYLQIMALQLWLAGQPVVLSVWGLDWYDGPSHFDQLRTADLEVALIEKMLETLSIEAIEALDALNETGPNL